jgi:hypothetical protein
VGADTVDADIVVADMVGIGDEDKVGVSVIHRDDIHNGQPQGTIRAHSESRLDTRCTHTHYSERSQLLVRMMQGYHNPSE